MDINALNGLHFFKLKGKFSSFIKKNCYVVGGWKLSVRGKK